MIEQQNELIQTFTELGSLTVSIDSNNRWLAPWALGALGLLRFPWSLHLQGIKATLGCHDSL